MNGVVTLGANRKHAGLSAYIAHISAVEVFADLSDGLEVDFAMLLNRLAVNAQDVKAASFSRERDLNLSVETTRSQQSRVEHVRSVSRHHALNSAQVLEAVQAVEQLHERALNFTIS